MPSQFPQGSTYNSAAIPFQKTDITNANGTFASAQADTDHYIAPFAGCIIGVGVGLNGTLTTGTLTFAPVIGGTVQTAFTDTIINAEVATNNSVNWGTYPFSAGDKLQLMYTKTGTVDPETRDASALMVVVFGPLNY